MSRDGKAGHRSQAMGLFKAMQRQSSQQMTFEEISIETLPIFPLLMGIFKKDISQLKQAPDYILVWAVIPNYVFYYWKSISKYDCDFDRT